MTTTTRATAHDAGSTAFFCTTCGEASVQRCLQCRLAYYCGREHQTSDWPKHKRRCAAGSCLDLVEVVSGPQRMFAANYEIYWDLDGVVEADDFKLFAVRPREDLPTDALPAGASLADIDKRGRANVERDYRHVGDAHIGDYWRCVTRGTCEQSSLANMVALGGLLCVADLFHRGMKVRDVACQDVHVTRPFKDFHLVFLTEHQSVVDGRIKMQFPGTGGFPDTHCMLPLDASCLDMLDLDRQCGPEKHLTNVVFFSCGQHWLLDSSSMQYGICNTFVPSAGVFEKPFTLARMGDNDASFCVAHPHTLKSSQQAHEFLAGLVSRESSSEQEERTRASILDHTNQALAYVRLMLKTREPAHPASLPLVTIINDTGGDTESDTIPSDTRRDPP